MEIKDKQVKKYQKKILSVSDVYKTFYKYKFAKRENKRFFRYGLVRQGLHVVNGVSMKVISGKVTGLLGPNGAGKTTTFYIIVGLITAEKGSVELQDVEYEISDDNNKELYEKEHHLLYEMNISHLPMYKRSRIGIGYLSQEPSIFRKLTVEDNIKAILEIRNLEKSELEKECDNLLHELNIDGIRKYMGYQLSGGERRRTEIARALAINPNFLLLDEPFAGIDPITVDEIKKIIEDLAKNKGIGILITDHNARETLSITDYSYIMAKGNILFQGEPQEAYNSQQVKEMYLGESFIF